MVQARRERRPCRGGFSCCATPSNTWSVAECTVNEWAFASDVVYITGVTSVLQDTAVASTLGYYSVNAFIFPTKLCLDFFLSLFF